MDAWIKAQAYRLYTWGTVTRLAAGGDMGAAMTAILPVRSPQLE